MVQLNHTGKNTVFFGKTRIIPGQNEIDDKEFYLLMRHPAFKNRLEKLTFTVPKDFPLVKPTNSVNQEETEEQDEQEEVGQNSERLSVKQTLKNIQKSKDVEYLKNLIETDDREKVQEAAKEKLESLEK